MKIYGLIGNPLGHSFSQKYFTEKFRLENIKNCTYLNFEIINLPEEIIRLKANPNLCGLNITIPYKSEIISYLNEFSKECEVINACNCIKVHENKWIGFNTDIIGFEKTFIKHLKPYHKRALLLGTGGSSKAVAYVLQKLNIEYLLVSRKKKATAGFINYEQIDSSTIQEYTVVINTTPVGMFPAMELSPALPYEFVTPEHYFFDLIYNPAKTLFLSKAEDRGAVIENGKKMLIIQADESWKIWNQKFE
ncbi:MAG: shikimate dehydrogenase [Ginsengibacter sp.]